MVTVIVNDRHAIFHAAHREAPVYAAKRRQPFADLRHCHIHFQTNAAAAVAFNTL